MITKSGAKVQSQSGPTTQMHTCAFLSRPPVEPPKMGDGVSAFRVGCTQAALGAAAAGAAAASARTTTDTRLETDATDRQAATGREVATGAEVRLRRAISVVLAELAQRDLLHTAVWTMGRTLKRLTQRHAIVIARTCNARDSARMINQPRMNCAAMHRLLSEGAAGLDWLYTSALYPLLYTLLLIYRYNKFLL